MLNADFLLEECKLKSSQPRSIDEIQSSLNFSFNLNSVCNKFMKSLNEPVFPSLNIVISQSIDKNSKRHVANLSTRTFGVAKKREG